MASSADEGRGTLREVPVRRVQPLAAGNVRMGKPTRSHVRVRRKAREPGELKHLSNPRKRDDFASSGERKRKSPNQRTRFSGVVGLVEAAWTKWRGLGRPAKEGDSPVHVRKRCDQYPEYRAAR